MNKNNHQFCHSGLFTDNIYYYYYGSCLTLAKTRNYMTWLKSKGDCIHMVIILVVIVMYIFSCLLALAKLAKVTISKY